MRPRGHFAPLSLRKSRGPPQGSALLLVLPWPFRMKARLGNLDRVWQVEHLRCSASGIELVPLVGIPSGTLVRCIVKALRIACPHKQRRSRVPWAAAPDRCPTAAKEEGLQGPLGKWIYTGGALIDFRAS